MFTALRKQRTQSLPVAENIATLYQLGFLLYRRYRQQLDNFNHICTRISHETRKTERIMLFGV